MSKLNWKERIAQAESGQSLVEMAISFVVLLFILMGILDLGRLYFVYVALEDGAGEGALYLSINPECRTEGDGEVCTAPNNADFRARFSGGQGVDWSEAEITIDRPDLYGVGDMVSVTIRYPFRLATPLISEIAQVNPLELTVTASEIIIFEPITDDEA